MRSLSKVLFLTGVILLSGVTAYAANQVYNAVTPCRIVDTRSGGGPFGTGEARTYHVLGTVSNFTAQGGTAGGCGLPTNASAIMFNFLAVSPLGAGNLKSWPAFTTEPTTGSTLNYNQMTPNLNIANGLVVPVTLGEGNNLNVKTNGAGTQLVIDVMGYFAPPTGFDFSVAPASISALGGLPLLLYSNGDVRIQNELFFSATERITFSGNFEFSAPLEADILGSRENVYVNTDGPDGNSAVYFWRGGGPNEDLTWNLANTRFEFSDDVRADTFTAGTNEVVTYNKFGIATPSSAALAGAGDLFVGNELEVGAATYLSKTLYMEGSAAAGADGDQNIYFYNGNSRANVMIGWDDVRSDAACSGTSATTQAMIFGYEASPNATHAWLFIDNPTGTFFVPDIEAKIDDLGNVAIDGNLTTLAACDLAETFLGHDLAPGTVVVMDPERPEGVRSSSAGYQATVVGIVSTEPGVLLNGPTKDFLDHSAALREEIAVLSKGGESKELEARTQELERMRDSWQRGNIPVALVGRVPVKVDGTYGDIHMGDSLTTSPTTGHAMVMKRPGPSIGVALEDFTGERGAVLVMVRTGWASPRHDRADAPEIAENSDNESSEDISTLVAALVRQSLASQEEQEPSAVRVRPGLKRNIEDYQAFREPVQAGDVVVVDREIAGLLRPGSLPGDPGVVGIVAGGPAILTGDGLADIAEVRPELASSLSAAERSGDEPQIARVWQQLGAGVRAPVALSGMVRAKVDASYGSIAVGDLLIVSPTRGHAMRADAPLPGTIVAKALESMGQGRGTIRVLVMPR